MAVLDAPRHTTASRPAPRRSLLSRVPKPVSLLLFGVAILLVWQAIVSVGLVSRVLLPGPIETFARTWEAVVLIVQGEYVLQALITTTLEAVLGFVLAVVVGFVLGCIVGETKFGTEIVMPYLVALNVMPKVTFAPVFVAWFGFGITSKVVMAAFIAFFPILVDTAAGLAAADKNKLMLFQSLGASRWQTLRKLKLPSAMPYFFAGLKTASVFVVVGAVVGEYLGGGRGLGELVKLSASQLRLDTVFAYIIILSVVGVVLYAIVGWLERKLVFWHHSSRTETTSA